MANFENIWPGKTNRRRRCNCDIGTSCVAGDSKREYAAYPETHLHDGQTLGGSCETGVMFETAWDEGYGNGLVENGFGDFKFTLVDEVRVPAGLEPGAYALSWRWDCEQTPQVWNSCADITVV